MAHGGNYSIRSVWFGLVCCCVLMSVRVNHEHLYDYVCTAANQLWLYRSRDTDFCLNYLLYDDDDAHTFLTLFTFWCFFFFAHHTTTKLVCCCCCCGGSCFFCVFPFFLILCILYKHYKYSHNIRLHIYRKVNIYRWKRHKNNKRG